VRSQVNVKLAIDRNTTPGLLTGPLLYLWFEFTKVGQQQPAYRHCDKRK
jgi:hypothetical protein